VTVDLSGKTALITGASRGIGEGLAAAFRDAGARVHILADDEGVFATGSRLGVAAHRADITDADAVNTAIAALPVLDILVNNAGLERMTPLDDPDSIDVFRRILDINVAGTTIVTMAALRRLSARGCIINTASIWGRVAEPLFGAYVASKHAVIGLTKTWAKELGPRGLRVNAVCPGWVKTEASLLSARRMAERTGSAPEAVIAAVEAAQALPSGLMLPADIAGPYLFLASDLAANVTGQTLGVDRGEVPW
jgi:3-hydroxybutyrate dehydrogenase